MKNNAYVYAVFQAEMYHQKLEVLQELEVSPRLHKGLLNVPGAVTKAAQWDPVVDFARQS